MQTILRAKDAVERGNCAVTAVIPGTRSESFCLELGLDIEYVNINIKYIDIFAAIKTAKIINNYKIDIIVAGKTELLSLVLLARRLSRKRKIPVVLYQQMQSGIIKKDMFHNWIYSGIDGAIVLTNLMKKELAATTILPREKIEVIPYGIETDKYNPKNFTKLESRQLFGLPIDKLIIGNVARIEPEKGQVIALEAYAKAGLNDALLVFAGNTDDNEYHRQLIQKACEFNISDNIMFIEFTKEIPALMNCFDIFVLPSQSETFGLVLIEAMAAGLPVIATDSGGVPEIVTSMETGLLFEQNDAKTLAEHFRLLAGNEKLRQKMGQNALNISRNRYDYKQQTDKFFEYCRQLV
jgi:glycosyltransferase involved in cell wall biosynthesis